MDISKFYEKFCTFKRRAFRLETLPQYDSDEERGNLRAFLAGEQLFQPIDPEWPKMIAAHVSAGKTMSRVHSLPEVLTPYLRYEIDWGYAHNIEAGEDVRLLTPDAPAEVRALATRDFWLFDDEVVLMNYDGDGRLQGVELERDLARTSHYIAMMDVLLTHAVPVREYLSKVRRA